jgi:hypothetical protein
MLVFTTTARNSESVIGVAAVAFAGHPQVLVAILLGPIVELPALLGLSRLMLTLRTRLRWPTQPGQLPPGGHRQRNGQSRPTARAAPSIGGPDTRWRAATHSGLRARAPLVAGPRPARDSPRVSGEQCRPDPGQPGSCR